MNNLPLIVPKSTRPTISKPRETTKSRNRDPNFVYRPNPRARPAEEALEIGLADDFNALRNNHVEEMKKAEDEIRRLKLECDALVARNSKISLSPNAIKENPEMFSFYTGLRDYETFKLLFDSFVPAAEKLLYCGSNTNRERVTESGKK